MTGNLLALSRLRAGRLYDSNDGVGKVITVIGGLRGDPTGAVGKLVCEAMTSLALHTSMALAIESVSTWSQPSTGVPPPSYGPSSLIGTAMRRAPARHGKRSATMAVASPQDSS